ncbi:DUF3800 domain-containing protein [Roseomonas sp. F4]
MPTAGYVAYIDEAGDDGIKRVRPIDPGGASEWFVLGAYVVEADKAPETPQRVRTILEAMKASQRSDVHFARLGASRRLIACQELAKHRSTRCFMAISHKPNMRGYRNPRAERVGGGKNVFYNFMARILLEKITRYCFLHSMRRHREPRHVRIEFSNRGGHSYSLMRGYLGKLYIQSKNGSLFLRGDEINWSSLDIQDIHNFDHANSPGLQLADVATSAFYQALGESDGRPADPSYAKILEPLMAKAPHGTAFGTGVKFMPNFERAPLSDSQREIFEFYGAPKTRSGEPPAPHTTGRG